MTAAGADNNDANSNIIIFIQRHKIICSGINLSASEDQKLLKLLSKGFERWVYWNEYKIKSENKNATSGYRYFLRSNFVGVSRLLVLVYSDQDDNAKRFKMWRRYYLPKGIIDNYNVIMNGKNFYDQPIDSNIKRYEEIKKLATGQGEGYTAGFSLDYDYIKSHFKLIAIDLSRQKKLDVNPKAIQQIEFIRQLKKLNANNNYDDSMFVLTIKKLKKQD